MPRSRRCTRLTKMSSSELWRVLRSLKPMPSSPSRRSSDGDAGAARRWRRRCTRARCRSSLSVERPVGELRRDRGQRLAAGCSVSCRLAELLHQRGLLLDQDQLALVDDADAVGHLLGLLDVVGGEDDGDAALAQPAHQLPHVAAQLDVDAGGRLVEEQDLGLVRQRLGDHHAPLHAARERHDLGRCACPTATGRAAPSRCAPGSARVPNRPRLKRDRRPDGLERVGGAAPAAPGRSSTRAAR